jgi:plastocyanin
LSATAATPVPPDLAPRPRRSRRRLWLALAAALLVLAALAVVAVLVVRAELDPGDPVSGVTDVVVSNNEFEPAAIEVPLGTTVTWRWQGEEKHNVVADGFESPTQTTGVFAHTFAETGTFAYECTLHYFMRGEVVVTDTASGRDLSPGGAS